MPRLALIVLIATLTLALPGVAPAAENPDVDKLQRALSEVVTAKRGAVGEVAAQRRLVQKALAKCRTEGPGWQRIRAVKVAQQRDAYRRGATQLWKNLNELALDRGALEAYRPIYQRFGARFEQPLADAALQAGVDSWRSRLAYHEEATAIANCKTFERMLAPVRQFPENVSADFKVGAIYNRMVKLVADTQRKAGRRHWSSSRASALEAAAARLLELGGNSGMATMFEFGHSLRG